MSDEDIHQNAMSDPLMMANEATSDGNWSLTAYYLQKALQQFPQSASFNAALWRTLALRTLEGGDFYIRWDMAKLIAKAEFDLVQPADVAALLDKAADEDESFIWFLVRILGDLGGDESISALVDLLKRSPAEDVVSAIVLALSQIGAAAIPTVYRLLDTPETRPAAVQVLARIRHPDAANALVGTIKDIDPEIRTLAVSTLGDAQHPQAGPILIEALTDVAPEVRRAAIAGLGVGPSVHAPTTVAKMGVLLWDLNLGVRRAAILALSRLASDDAAKLLYDALQSQSTPPVLQCDLIQAIARTETAAGIGYLSAYAADLDFLPGTNEAIYDTIATSLGRIETPDLIPAAVTLLEMMTRTTNVNSSTRRAIATSLGQLGCVSGSSNAVDILIHMLADADTGVRLHITAALRKLAPIDARQRLAAIVTSPQATDELKQTALLALQDWDQSAYPDTLRPN
ncbi:MAG: HEAT repeat domain-containing protein [Elainellaceae cyanobacterium]